jgi:membrane associated rhomboid family serine protease
MMNPHKAFTIAFYFTLCLWLAYFTVLLLHLDIARFAVQPRQISGLPGILTNHFMHGSFAHLMQNSIIFLPLSGIACMIAGTAIMRVFLVIAILSGVLVWLLGASHSLHFGISSVTFGLLGFILVYGLISRRWFIALGSILVFPLYGGLLFQLFTPVAGISWIGHASGFLGGIIAANLEAKINKRRLEKDRQKGIAHGNAY